MNRSRCWTTVLALMLAAPLAACGGGDAEMEDEPMEETPAMEAEAEAEPGAMEPMTIELASKNESGVTGEATATHGDDQVTVEVRIMGAGSDGDYPAHIHSGDCASPGSVLAPLDPIPVAGGAGSSSTGLAADQVSADQPSVIQVHDPSGAPVACGDLSGHGDAM